ncbi:hypothetical protein TFLX_03197 [Thermoflexales bacterium]|nr:hypothetical protein TFLX_03197 [Thermoflexales bacterium]
MSLSDHLRYLRALHGGPSNADLRQVLSEEDTGLYFAIEQRYRDVSTADILPKIAAYYHVPVEELQWHRARSRKALALHIHAALQDHAIVALRLRTGETLIGYPVWWDLAAIGLQPIGEEDLVVVQRHAVIDWEGSNS